MIKGVVELFTSQGCSSCPPADAALKTLVDDGDVVALAYHVDYWNYLGWADTLAPSPETKNNSAQIDADRYAVHRFIVGLSFVWGHPSTAESQGATAEGALGRELNTSGIGGCVTGMR